MQTKEEIIQRLNDLKVEELKLLGKLELLAEQEKAKEETPKND